MVSNTEGAALTPGGAAGHRAGGHGTGTPDRTSTPCQGCRRPGLTAGSCRSSAGCNAPAAYAKTASWGRPAAVPALRSGGHAAHPTSTQHACRQLQPRPRRLPALLWLSPGGLGLAGPGRRSRASPPPARPSASPGPWRARAAQPRGGAPALRDGPGAEPGVRSRGVWGAEGMGVGSLGAIPGCTGAVAWPLGCALNRAAPSDTSVNESPARVPMRSLFSLQERQLMALAQCVSYTVALCLMLVRPLCQGVFSN